MEQTTDKERSARATVVDASVAPGRARPAVTAFLAACYVCGVEIRRSPSRLRNPSGRFFCSECVASQRHLEAVGEAISAGRVRGSAALRARLLAAAGDCGSPACRAAACSVGEGMCHRPGCTNLASVAKQTHAGQSAVRGFPRLYCSSECQRRAFGRASKTNALEERARTDSKTVAQVALELGWNARTVSKYADALGLGTRFARTGGKGGTRLLTESDILGLRKVRLARLQREEFHQRKIALGLRDLGEVAEALRVTPAMVHVYVRRGLLSPSATEVIAAVRYRLFADAEISRFKREWARGSAARRTRWQDPDFVVRRYRSRGHLELLSSKHNVDLEEAEALIRRRVELRAKELRQRRKGRKRAEHRQAWQAQYERLSRDLAHDYEERKVLGLLVAGEAPPSKWQICSAVAEHDFRTHPERWAGYACSPSDPGSLDRESERRAADRVYRLLANAGPSLPIK
jgi:hypothetical protein